MVGFYCNVGVVSNFKHASLLLQLRAKHKVVVVCRVFMTRGKLDGEMIGLERKLGAVYDVVVVADVVVVVVAAAAKFRPK